MKNILLKLICVFTISLGLNTSTKAQLVYIPDSAFRVYLNQNFGACMVGDSIDSSCPGVLNAKIINISGKGISDLSGIEVFVNDSVLNCKSNFLSQIPTLPNSIQILDISNNQITNLVTLPNSLKWLDCDYNQLSNLPSLPNTLSFFTCNNNQIISIPQLPNSLITLECKFNLLSSLPNLPNSLEVLLCAFNSITSLPSLPNTLISLGFESNLITTIPSLPSSLYEIGFGVNPVSIIPPLPAGLRYLSFFNTLVSTIPTLPDSLVRLYCPNNQITSIPTLPSTVTSLYCNNNQLTSLPELPNNLFTMDCSNNQITSIPKISSHLHILDFSNNPVGCFPDMQTVTFLTFSGTLINCIPPYYQFGASTPPISTFPKCDVFNSNGCDVFWNIAGKIYQELDSNCLIGNNESKLINQKLNLYKNGILSQQTYSYDSGEFDFNTFSFDLYTTELDVSGLPFNVHCPSLGFYNDSITAIDSMKFDRDFGLICNGIDLAATSIITNNLRPASVEEIKIQTGDYSQYFGANCASGISGIVSITITGPCNYHSPGACALTPNSVNGNVLTYNVSNFDALNFYSSFNFNIIIDTSAAIGSLVCIQVSIASNTNELNYYNNLLSQCFTVVGSFDPNDKTAFPNSTLDISGDRWLTYLIRFQNTGTAFAEHIFITDTLSTSLDWSTFSLLSYSHQPLTQVYNDGLVKFSFPHINLPDSNTNEPASHGYFQYKIRAKDSLSIGSTIENSANIFFDFNAPIITNTTSNAVINCSIPPNIITASICNGEAYSLNGALYYNDGTYQQKLITSVGCDSIIELQLTVSSISNTISQSSAILQTTASGSGYQWIDCATNTAISGATNSTYQPTQSGDYAVAVTYGNCIDTSACFSFTMVGLPSSIVADVIFQTRYNSNLDNILLHAEKLKGNKGVLRLIDISGRIIFQKQIENIAAGNLDIEISAKGMNAGIYLVNLITERDNISGKVVKY